jgi:uncharacterized protein with NRDE domain
MCLLVVAWNAHPKYRVVIAGNRDEFHKRPSAALGWWKEAPSVLAGRDLEASGTWLGLSRGGRFGIVTNFRDFERPPPPGAPSRGELVPRFLSGNAGAEGFLDELHGSSQDYGGFNLLVGGPRSLHYYSNRGGDRPRVLGPGIYGLSNQWLDTPWPKLVRTRERFEALLSNGGPAAEELFAMLADRTTAGDAELLRAGFPEDWERAVSAPFVVHERYGTRCSTVVLIERDGRTVVHERRFDPSGAQSGASRFQFASGETADRARPVAEPAHRDEPARPVAAFDASPE